MISLFVIYILIVIVYCICQYFGSSLESVQYFHNKLYDPELTIDKLIFETKFETKFDTKFETKFDKQVSLILLNCCVMSSIIYSERDKFYDFEINPQNPRNQNQKNQSQKIQNQKNQIQKIQGCTFTYKSQTIGFVSLQDPLHGAPFAVITCVSTSCLSDVIFSSFNKLIDVDDGKIHEGYYIHAMEFIPDVLKILSSRMDIRRLYITGHSLGGTLASIVGYLLSTHFGYDSVIYAFGSPKFGDCDTKKSIESSSNIVIHNVLNTADLIINKPSNRKYVRIGNNVRVRKDTGNNNVNHGIKIYRKILLDINSDRGSKNRSDEETCTRPHRFDEILSRMFLDLLG